MSCEGGMCRSQGGFLSRRTPAADPQSFGKSLPDLCAYQNDFIMCVAETAKI